MKDTTRDDTFIDRICLQKPGDPDLPLTEEEIAILDLLATEYATKGINDLIINIDWAALRENLPEFLRFPEVSSSEKLYGDLMVLIQTAMEEDYDHYEQNAMPVVRDFISIFYYSRLDWGRDVLKGELIL